MTSTESRAAEKAIGIIGRGYDITSDIGFKYCRDQILKVSNSIKSGRGERTNFRSDVLTFQQMSEQFNQEMSLAGKVPSGLFNAMFDFSGVWQKDEANTKSLALDGLFITCHTIALDKSQMVLLETVKKDVPGEWNPAALARFIKKYGTHVIVGAKLGGKDVIYAKQQHSSNLPATNFQKRLQEEADKKFLNIDVPCKVAHVEVHQQDKFNVRELWQRFVNSIGNLSRSLAHQEDMLFIHKRRGGIVDGNLSHAEWQHSVTSDPDVISMTFVPITSLLNGVMGTGYLTHAINLYLRYKPTPNDLHHFLEFQLPKQWAPSFNDLPLGPQRKLRNSDSLRFCFLGPKLFVNTDMVDVDKKPVTGMRLFLEGKKNNCLAIHLQHLSSLPQTLLLSDAPDSNAEALAGRDSSGVPSGNGIVYQFEKVRWKHFDLVCTSVMESKENHSIVTGAQLCVESRGFHNVLFLRLRFSVVQGPTARVTSEWDSAPEPVPRSGFVSTLISHRLTSVTKPPPPPFAADVNINSAVYDGQPPVPVQAPKFLNVVDVSEFVRGPENGPGYWVVTGARLAVERGKISLHVKYSLFSDPPPPLP